MPDNQSEALMTYRLPLRIGFALVLGFYLFFVVANVPTLVIETGGELLPQAMRNPASVSIKHIPATVAAFDILRPAKPTITTPARGKASGSQGRRLSDRWRNVDPTPLFGPAVWIVMVTVDVPDPAGIVADVDGGPLFTL